MSEDWFELAIIAFIIAGIGLTLWKGGQRNPVGTGSLDKDVVGLKGQVAAISTKVDTIETQVKHIERRSASSSDIERLERQITEQGRLITEQSMHLAEVGEAVAAIREAGDQRGKQLDRLYDFIVQRGMSK